MKSFSVICCYNNLNEYQNLVQSLNILCNYNVQIIGIDNSNNIFSNIITAYLNGIEQCHNDIILFVHQDIEFLSSCNIDYMLEYLKNNINTIIGAAGVKYKSRTIYSSIYEGKVKYKHSMNEVNEKVFVLDECLFALNKNIFNQIEFDSITCNNWHFYAVDLCLQNYLNHGNNIVLSLDLWHKSGGNKDKSFYNTEKRLAKKYKKLLKVINTTCTYVYTNPFLYFCQRLYRLDFIRQIRFHIKKVMRG